ncbi:MAG: gluconolactonase [Mesorhizobium amorphae]|nr:MAG: gluconolactonase [Mesorhizobium amorphae]
MRESQDDRLAAFHEYALDRDWSGTDPLPYPDPAIEILDERFEDCVQQNSVVERLWTGGRWAEGPVWFGDARHLLWSDIPNDRIMRWTEETGAVSTFRAPAGFSNGHTRDGQGRLISCHHGTRSVTRTEHDGTLTTLLDRFDSKSLNAPNDVVCHPDGSIWFTDPGYGILSDYEGNRAEFELPTRVYRLDPASGAAKVVAEDHARPNGLCFSPDFSKLYVVDTGRSEPDFSTTFTLYEVASDGQSLAHPRPFGDMGVAGSDGIRCDEDGRLWAASGGGSAATNGVHVFDPDGTRIGAIHLPEVCANLCFGGRKKTRLFMAASRSIYSLMVTVRGA